MMPGNMCAGMVVKNHNKMGDEYDIYSSIAKIENLLILNGK